MKILRVGWWYKPFRSGGLIEYVEDIMEEMSKKGHQEIYFCAGAYNLFPFAYLKEGKFPNNIKYYEIINSPNIAPKKLDQPLSDIRQQKIENFFYRVIEKESPDIIHIHEFEGLCANIMVVAKKLNIPVVVSLHNYWSLCPQVNLFDHVKKEICLDYFDGKRCLMCRDFSPHKTTSITKIKKRLEKYKRIHNFSEKFMDFLRKNKKLFFYRPH